MANSISNSDNVIDSRDIIERIESLQEEAQEDGLLEHEAEELVGLKALAEEASSSPDWEHGESLIRDTYFKEYAQELSEDIGAIDHNVSWPLHCIDWDQATDELKMDYLSVDYDGVEYWIRA